MKHPTLTLLVVGICLAVILGVATKPHTQKAFCNSEACSIRYIH